METDALTRLSYAPLARRKVYRLACGCSAPTAAWEPELVDTRTRLSGARGAGMVGAEATAADDRGHGSTIAAMAAFLANIGVNAAHPVRSPLFPDGSFVVYPIPEALPWAPPMRRLPDVWRDRAVHVDPDLDGDPPTYGDNCRTAGRAYSLRRAQPGDLIFFMARLHPDSGEPSGFFLVGSLSIAAIQPDVREDPGPGWWDGNAHVRRARAGHGWNSFWVFRGDQRSGFFDRAVPFCRSHAEHVFGPTWDWREHRTELQTIGSYTRSIRRLTGASERGLRELCA